MKRVRRYVSGVLVGTLLSIDLLAVVFVTYTMATWVL